MASEAAGVPEADEDHDHVSSATLNPLLAMLLSPEILSAHPPPHYHSHWCCCHLLPSHPRSSHSRSAFHHCCCSACNKVSHMSYSNANRYHIPLKALVFNKHYLQHLLKVTKLSILTKQNSRHTFLFPSC